MGVRRLFSRGGQNFPGGPKTSYLAKKMPKNIPFSPKKVKKSILFLSDKGGKCPLLPSPADAHDLIYQFSVLFAILKEQNILRIRI